MREIQVAENKTLKLTNVLARKIDASELGNQLIPRLEPGYEQDAVLRVKGCLYAHFTGPMDHSSLASQKLNIYAYEHEIELTGTTYSIYVNQDSENGVMDVFMETK